MPVPVPVGSVAGLYILVNVSPLRLYMFIYGEVAFDTERYEPSGLKAVALLVEVGNVAGSESFVNTSPARLYIVIYGEVA